MHDPVEGRVLYGVSAVMGKLQVQSTSKIAHVLAQQQSIGNRNFHMSY